MKFTLKKSKPKKIKKVRKKVSEVKININSNGFIKGKTVTKVFKMNSIEEIQQTLIAVDPNVRLKLLINYNSNEFYVFKSEYIKKKTSFDLENSELNNDKLAYLLKSFYSDGEMQWDDSFLKKSSKLKYEIAPRTFEIKDNYLLSENKYINVISLEHLGKNLNIKNIIENNDCWLAIDCYKVANEYILNKLDEMKNDKVIEKRFSDFVSNKLDDIIVTLKNETIFQCEIKLLLYNSNLERISEENAFIRENLLVNHYTSYIPQEKLNTRKLFEKCIYPNMNMDIIHSIISEDLYALIRG